MDQTRSPWSSPGDMPFGPRVTPNLPTIRPNGPGNVARFSDPHHYATVNGDLILPIGTADVLALQAPDDFRNFLCIRNSGATTLFVSFGNQATTNSTIRIASNVMILFDEVVPQGDVHVISDAAGGQVSIAFANLPA